ncbi:hypothetical protein GGS23DRAFT_555663, partial [Durotheca rogersii]|uniref:uncharacterized protein n=1 Tax=Durotheca rogersii TaxID=419775 RepID=UPI00222054EA
CHGIWLWLGVRKGCFLLLPRYLVIRTSGASGSSPNGNGGGGAPTGWGVRIFVGNVHLGSWRLGDSIAFTWNA